METKPYKTYLTEFGNNLRNIRQRQGLSMESLANDAEIEYRQLGRIERGEINTTIISLLKIAKALNVDIKILFDFDSEIIND